GLRRRGGGDRPGRQPRSGLHSSAQHLREADDPRRALRQEDRIRDYPPAGSGMRRPARILGASLSLTMLAGVASAQPQPEPQRPPPAMQWLYGSGEGGAISVQ